MTRNFIWPHQYTKNTYQKWPNKNKDNGCQLMLQLEFEHGTLLNVLDEVPPREQHVRLENVWSPSSEHGSDAKKRTRTSFVLLWTSLSYIKRDLAKRVVYIQQRRQDYWKWLCNAEQLCRSDETVPRRKFPSNVGREGTMGLHSMRRLCFNSTVCFRMQAKAQVVPGFD